MKKSWSSHREAVIDYVHFVGGELHRAQHNRHGACRHYSAPGGSASCVDVIPQHGYEDPDARLVQIS